MFEDVILFDELLVQPVGMFDPRDGIGDALQRGRDRDDLGDRPAQSLNVVIPIQNTRGKGDMKLGFQDFFQPIEDRLLLQAKHDRCYKKRQLTFEYQNLRV